MGGGRGSGGRGGRAEARLAGPRPGHRQRRLRSLRPSGSAGSTRMAHPERKHVMRAAAWLVLAVLVLPAAAEAKKFRYAGGPEPATDTVYSVARGTLEPIPR